MQNQHLVKYINEGFNQVIGFCALSTLQIIDYLDAVEPKTGGALEIGIHHGQFFIAMNQLVPRDFVSCAVDVFGNQNLNIDNSGEGNKEIFIENLRKYDRHQGENVLIIEGDSTNESTLGSIGSFHYISVDGGHTPEHVINDLKIASNKVTPNGIVILDDYFNHWWPSVTEGAMKFLSTSPTLVPFATSANKMWMCKLSYKQKYLQHMDALGLFNKTTTSFMGHKIIDLW